MVSEHGMLGWYSLIHFGDLCSASSNPLLFIGAPDYSINTVSELIRQSDTGNCEWRTCSFPKVPTWRLEWLSNLWPSGRKAPNLPLNHVLNHAPRMLRFYIMSMGGCCYRVQLDGYVPYFQLESVLFFFQLSCSAPRLFRSILQFGNSRSCLPPKKKLWPVGYHGKVTIATADGTRSL